MKLFKLKPKNDSLRDGSDTRRRRRQPQQVDRRSEAASRRASSEQNRLFERNRTLTDESMSRHEMTRAGKLATDRIHIQHLKKKRKNLGLIFFVMIVASGALGFLAYQFTATPAIATSSSILIPADERNDFSRSINDYFSQRPVERFRFNIDSDQLKAHLQAAHPEIKNLEILASHTIGESTFSLEFRTPVAVWSQDGVRQYVDGSGVTFKKNYHNNPSVKVEDNSGVRMAPGSTIASNRFLGFIGQAVKGASERSIKVNKIVIPEASTRQIAMHIEPSDLPVYLSVDRGVNHQLEDMDRALKHLAARDVVPSYIDVRVSGRAYYK